MAETGAKITPVAYSQFGRVGTVELWMKGQKIKDIDTEGLDFKFQTNDMFLSTATAVPNSATVQILGLTQKHVDYLCQYCNDAAYLRREISARVLAGYNNDPKGPQELIHMLVMRATPSMPPNNWVTLTLSMLQPAEKLKSYTYCYQNYAGNPDPSLYTMMKRMEGELGVMWIWHTGTMTKAEKTSVDFFGFNGGVYEAVQELKKKFRFLRFVQSASIFSKTGGPCYDLYAAKGIVDDEGKYIGDNWHETDTSVTTWNINKDSGMIGIPTSVGVSNDEGGEGTRKIRVRTLLNPSIRAQDEVFLTSDICKGLNGRYKVWTVKHTGHLRGNEWYSDLVLSDASTSQKG